MLFTTRFCIFYHLNVQFSAYMTQAIRLGAICLFTMVFATGCKQPGSEAATATTGLPSISAMEPSTDFPEAAIASMDYQNGQFNFQIGGGFALGQQTPDAPQKMCANSAQGQHLHLIVNDRPYEAKYESTFRHLIPDGSHYLLAFLSRSYHESIKTPRAHVVVKAEIKDSSFKKLDPVTSPMLFYSRPKGVYLGEDARRIMLDFYLVNCNLGNDYKVKVEIGGKEFLLDQWQPYIIEGLPMGEHRCKLSLVDASGVLVQAPLNPVERTFSLQPSPEQ